MKQQIIVEQFVKDQSTFLQREENDRTKFIDLFTNENAIEGGNDENI